MGFYRARSQSAVKQLRAARKRLIEVATSSS